MAALGADAQDRVALEIGVEPVPASQGALDPRRDPIVEVLKPAAPLAEQMPVAPPRRRLVLRWSVPAPVLANEPELDQ